MTVNEVASILEYIHACYPDRWRNVNERNMIKAWSDQFAGCDPDLVQAAVKAYVATDSEGYVPGPGQIKAQMVKLQTLDAPTPNEVWSHIRAAISNSGYHASEEFEKLSPVEQRLVGSPRQLYDWGQMDVERLDTVVASNIQRAYRTEQERHSYMMALPPVVKERLEQLTEHLRLPQ